MTVSVYLPLFAALLLCAVSRPLGSRLSPGIGVRALVTAAAITALTSTWGLLLLAGTLVHEAPPITERATAYGGTVPEPVPGFAAAAAAAGLAVGGYRLAEQLRRRRATYEALRRLGEPRADGELVVAEASEPYALAVPGRPGRIVVSSGMLLALAADERRALLAHERAHLSANHHLWQTVVDAAAAVNPLLIPVRGAVKFLIERWADEEAAEAVGSRLLVARSLARAALATTAAAPGRLAFERLAVTSRVAALQAPPTPPGHVLASTVVLLGIASALAAGDATLGFADFLSVLVPGI